MNPIKLHPTCIRCLLDKHLNACPPDFPAPVRLAYTQSVLRILGTAAASESAPEVLERIDEEKARLGFANDAGELKRHFNHLVLQREKAIRCEIHAAPDPLRAAIGYALVGNYIDFGAMENVDEAKLGHQLEQASGIPLDGAVFSDFCADLASARSLVYLTDNCGEILLDKLLIEVIRERFPHLSVRAIVRGRPVLNDATMDDALQVGLTDTVPVIANGTQIAGTSLARISEEARQAIDTADVILSKGQGNFETLYHCGLNVYYLFLCKCRLFSERFGVSPCTGMFLRERAVPADF